MGDERRQAGSTLFELLSVLSVLAILAAVTVPGAAAARRTFAAASAPARLALVLRSAQARAQSGGCTVTVAVDGSGAYRVTQGVDGIVSVVAQGDLGAGVASNYPQGAVQFGEAGWPCLAGTTTPRAGTFSVGGTGSGHLVVVQLGGCVRCA